MCAQHQIQHRRATRSVALLGLGHQLGPPLSESANAPSHVPLTTREQQLPLALDPSDSLDALKVRTLLIFQLPLSDQSTYTGPLCTMPAQGYVSATTTACDLHSVPVPAATCFKCASNYVGAVAVSSVCTANGNPITLTGCTGESISSYFSRFNYKRIVI